MYIGDELFRAINEPGLAREAIARFAALEATLADFVTSRSIDPDYLFLLTPTNNCVWAIKSVRPEPSLRVFGLFADRDAFVATNYELRKNLAEFDSKAWQWSSAKAKAVWKNLFPGYQPKNETDIKQLISGALDGKYFK
jgi:hypothetical protein